MEAAAAATKAAEAKEAMRAASLAKREAMELRTALAEAQAKVAEAEAAAKAAEAKTAEARAAAAEAAALRRTVPARRPGAPEMDPPDAAVDGGVHASGRERHARVDVATRPTPRIRGARERWTRRVAAIKARSRPSGGDAVSVRVGHASNPGSARAGSASTVGGTRGEGAAGDAEWGGGDARGERADVVHRRGGGGGRGCWEPRVGGGRRIDGGRRARRFFQFCIGTRDPRWCSSVVVSSRGSYWYAVFGTLFACGEDGAERRGRVSSRLALDRGGTSRPRGVCLERGAHVRGSRAGGHLAGSRSRRGDELRRARTARAGASR